jgi:hypothetical protein
VNFDGTSNGVQVLSSALLGFNDWANVRLDQIGAGRRAVRFQDGDFADYGSGDFIDFGSGDFIDYGSGDFIDFGSGDFVDYGSGVFQNTESGDFVDFGSGDFVDFGSGDFIDFGSGDFLDFGTGTERQEISYDSAKRLGKGAPYALTACVIGTPGCTGGTPYILPYHRVEVHLSSSALGHVFQYVLQRKKGNASSPDPYVAAGTSPTKTHIDLTELQDGAEYTYRARTEFDDTAVHTFSPWSKPVTVTAVNERPVANADNYSTNEDTPLIVPAPSLPGVAGVLGNDTDVDSPTLTVDLSSVVGPSNGALTMSANGSFVYTPNLNFFGSDSFTYKAKDAFRDSSAAATVSITVYPVNDAPSFSFTATSPPVDTVGKGSGPRVVPGWVTVSPGPANSTPAAVPPASESGQAVDFTGLVTNNNNALFSVQPAISPAGTLTYTPASNKSGVATVTVRIHDNGGTDNGHGGGGVNSSAPKTFTISVVPGLK